MPARSGPHPAFPASPAHPAHATAAAQPCLPGHPSSARVQLPMHLCDNWRHISHAQYSGTAAATTAAVGAGAVVGSAFADDTPSPPPGTATPAIEQLRTANALTDAAYAMDLPSQSAGRIRRHKMNELATIHEALGDWARISPSTTAEERVMKAYIAIISP